MSDTAKKPSEIVAHLWFLMGFIAIGSQVVILRSGMVIFSGNEMVVGPILFSWTAWMGVGSLAGGYIRGEARGRMKLLLGAGAVLLPVTHYIISGAKQILGVAPAVLVSPGKSFLFLVPALAPICLCTGAAFAVGCRLGQESPGTAVARTYLWDALGAGLGGLVAGGLLLPVLSADRAIFVIPAIAAAGLALDSGKDFRRSAGWAALAVAALALIFTPYSTRLSHRLAWPGYPSVAEEDSRYSHLMMTERDNEYNLFINGSPALTWPGGPSDETMAYLALSTTPDAEDVLLVGGGLTTVGAKLLDGPVERLDYCQIDPKAIEMEKRIPSDVWNDDRVRLHVVDGRRFIRNAEPKSFDLVVLEVGDPQTLAQNRYYTREFFKETSRLISDNGTLIFAVGEYANYISDKQALFLKSIRKALKSHFPRIEVYPLGRFYHAASIFNELPQDAGEIIQNMNSLGLKGEYFRPEKLRYDLTEHRFSSYRRAIKETPGGTVNTDNRPAGYAYLTGVWLSRFYAGGGGLESIRGALKPLPLMGILVLLLAAQFTAFRKGTRPWAVIPMVMIVGFAGMAFEMAAIYLVQVGLGALYGYIGLLVTLYMVGVSLGTTVSYRMKNIEMRRMLLLLFLGLVFLVNYAENPDSFLEISLLVLDLFVISFAAGIFFGLGALSRENVQHEAGKLGGLLNFADLAGGALAALFIPTLLIPLWGVTTSMHITALLVVALGTAGVLYIRKEAKRGAIGK